MSLISQAMNDLGMQLICLTFISAAPLSLLMYLSLSVLLLLLIDLQVDSIVYSSSARRRPFLSL